LVVCICLLIIGLAATASALLPYPTAKSLADSFARDGNLERLTESLFSQLRIASLVAGVLLTLCGSMLLVAGRKMQMRIEAGITRLLKQVLSDVMGIARDGRIFFRTNQASLLLVAGLIVLGAAIRITQINRPMEHDEAYTFVAFASRPIQTLISDYHLPNNHIYHSLLVHLSCRLFGNHPWAVRLPALAAGIGLIPAVFILAAQLYNRRVAVVCAALIIPIPYLVYYSTSGRGYTLVALHSLVSFSLAIYVAQKKNLAAWGAMVITLALGFYAVPVMLYPAGILFTWLAFHAVMGTYGKDYPSRKDFTIYLLSAGIAMAVLVFLLYAPVLITSGVNAVFGNKFVKPLSWPQFFDQFPTGLHETWDAWLAGLPRIGWLCALGLTASIVLHKKIARQVIPLWSATAAWLMAAILVQHPSTGAKIWVFLFPLTVIWVSAGILSLASLLFMRWVDPEMSIRWLSTAAVILVVGGSLFAAYRQLPDFEAEPGETESVAIFLKEELRSGDALLVASPLGVIVEYYCDLYAIPAEAIYRSGKSPAISEFNRVFILVNPAYHQSMEQVLAENKLEDQLLLFAQAEKLTEFGAIQMFRITRE
jgi:hypothetical protein